MSMETTNDQARVAPAVNWQWLAVVLMAAGVVLRLAGIGSHALSYDESFTAVLSLRPFGDMLAAAAGDVHPPLSYLLYWLMAHLAGNSAAVLRWPGLVFGVAAIIQVDLIAGRLHFS